MFWWSAPYFICAMVKSRYIGDGHPTFNRNPYNGYTNPYYWVDDHPLLYRNNGSTPKSWILIGFSIINHPFWVPLFLETPILCLNFRYTNHQQSNQTNPSPPKPAKLWPIRQCLPQALGGATCGFKKKWQLNVTKYTPQKKHGTPKLVVCRCFFLFQKHFSGSMLIFRGVLLMEEIRLTSGGW